MKSNQKWSHTSHSSTRLPRQATKIVQFRRETMLKLSSGVVTQNHSKLLHFLRPLKRMSVMSTSLIKKTNIRAVVFSVFHLVRLQTEILNHITLGSLWLAGPSPHDSTLDRKVGGREKMNRRRGRVEGRERGWTGGDTVRRARRWTGKKGEVKRKNNELAGKKWWRKGMSSRGGRMEEKENKERRGKGEKGWTVEEEE